MNKVCNIICTLLLIACSYGCDSELDEALLRAGDNRGEMEKVLEHFKNDPDGLKYDAARFLIINMPYHYTYTGACMDSLDSAYREMAAAPTQKRVEVFNNLKKNIDDSKAEPIVDINSVSAAYLINAVDDACYVWNHSGWSKDYDKSIFFDYVLPYRLLNEPLSDTITDRYRYLRYIGPNGSYCNINELVFYDEKGQQIKGKMIGTEGQPWASVEKVFDGDILTGFDAVSPDGHWVGLQPYSPSRVGKIRFIPRNDGNGVEIGDEYKLYYWHNDGWEEIANMKATRNELVFHKMPKGGLYVLRDMTKGHEERIFTYENGEQVWW